MTRAIRTDYPTVGTISEAEIELAMKRGRNLRSKAFTSFVSHLYHGIVGRSADHDLLLAKHEEDCTPARG